MKIHKERIFNNYGQLTMVKEFYKTKKGVVLISNTSFEYQSKKDRYWSEKLTIYYLGGLIYSCEDTELTYHENGKIAKKAVMDTEPLQRKNITKWFDDRGRIIKRYIESKMDDSSVLTEYSYDEFGNQHIASQVISATSKYADIFEILGYFSWTKDGYY